MNQNEPVNLITQPQPRSTLSPKKQANTASGSSDSTNVALGDDSCTHPFYLDAKILDLIDTPKIDVSVPQGYTVLQAVRKALLMFSQELLEKGIQVSIDTKNYTPRIAKKSGKPKMDMPCLDDEQKLSEIKITSICLQVMNENAVRLALKHPPLPEEHLNKGQEIIHNEINISRKEKEINPESNPSEKKDSGCFFSFC